MDRPQKEAGHLSELWPFQRVALASWLGGVCVRPHGCNIFWGERRELLFPLTRIQVSRVAWRDRRQDESWRRQPGGVFPHLCFKPCSFPRVTLEIGGRSEPNVPCIDVSIDFKLCRLYCWKLFVRWLIDPLQKEPFLSLNWPLYSVSSRFWSSVLLPHLGRSLLYSVFRGGLSDAKHPACVSVFQTSQRTCAPCCWFPSLLRTESDLFMTVPRRRSKWRVCRLRRKMICLATEKASEDELEMIWSKVRILFMPSPSHDC